MKAKTSYVSVTDQFCGAGGSSTGAKMVDGVEVKLAMNHWQLAIETHNTNHPDTNHVLADISQVDPRRYPPTDILITSPECTNHSLAKGKRRKNLNQLELWGDGNRIDPAEERSRATMWDVPRFAEFHNYRYIVVENVVDARRWRLFDAWLHAMRLLDYEVHIVYFNSMFAHPTPQSRDRMYIVFWKRGNPKPDLDIHPAAYCPACEQQVGAVQAWKSGKPHWGRYKTQYAYNCPRCNTVVDPFYYPAYTAIDWTLDAPRIGDRDRPLKPRTLERIAYGLDKYARQPVMVPLGHSHVGPQRAHPVNGVYPTQTTRQTLALAVPPFLVSYYGTENARSVDEPVGTVTTVDRHALVQPSDPPRVEDCGFRMLQPHEIQAAMAFPQEYVVLGTKRDQVRQLGNAVTPPVMKILMERCVAALK